MLKILAIMFVNGLFFLLAPEFNFKIIKLIPLSKKQIILKTRWQSIIKVIRPPSPVSTLQF
jgi:hypothetical protein